MDPASSTTHLSLLFKGYPWWLVLPLAAVLGYAAWRLCRRELQTHAKPGVWIRRLRFLVVFLIMLLLGKPVIQSVFAKYQEPHIVVLVDRSASMSVKDTQEPVERKVRAAIVLGLLPEKLRDMNADEAAALLREAQGQAEAGGAALRMAQQAVQEGETNAARQRLKEVCQALSRARSLAKDAFTKLKAAPPVRADAVAAAERSAGESERLAAEMEGTSVEGPGVSERLQDKVRLVNGLRDNLGRTATNATRCQDAVDRALGEKGDPAVKEALAKLDQMDRGTLVETLLKTKIKPLIEGKKLTLRVYRTDTDLHPAPDLQAELTGGVAGAAEKAAAEKAAQEAIEVGVGEEPKAGGREKAKETDLATPLIRLAEAEAQESIAAVVYCSDGRHTIGPLPDDAARALFAQGVKVHTLGVGGQKPPLDICVARLEGPLSVFQEETIRLIAHVKSVGFREKSCKLVLRRGTEVLQERMVKFTTDGWVQEPFELPADKPGPNLFIASIDPQPGEALTENNSAEAVVDVAGDKLRVLVVDEEPRWEARYVASLLRRERKMEMDERWLRYGQKLTPQSPALPEDVKKLDEYDLIVLGDVTPDRLKEEDQKRLAKFVSDRGGFLMVIAGQLAMPQKYLSGPIAELLPIQPVSGDSATTGLETKQSEGQPVRLKLAEAGASADIVRILRDPALNEQLWPLLPELNYVHRPAFAKKGATALLVTDDARKDVVVAAHYYGMGRVLYIGTDETWRWRKRVADRVHAFFWSQAIRWGTSHRLIGGPRLKVGVDRRQIRPGENIEILARPLGADGKPATDAVVVAELEQKTTRHRVQLQPLADSRGLYRGILANVPAGLHAVKVKVESAGFENVAEEVQVIAREVSGQEGVELSRDPVRLAAISQAGGGKNLDILQAPELFRSLSGEGKYQERESAFELWSSYPALALIVALLVIEWLVRKREGLA